MKPAITAGTAAVCSGMERAAEVPLEDLELSLTAYLCLKRAGCRTLKELTQMTVWDLTAIPQLTRRNLDEICLVLERRGAALSTLRKAI